jgi:hypothetical protein
MFARVVGLICMLYASVLFGGLKDCLKPVLNKEGSHSMRNIDFIYTINLDGRPE